MMKHRFRKKHNNSQGDKRSVNPLKHSYESNSSGGRLRGNAQQLHEKYSNLAREALGNGDRVLMENYFQHAEHYQRLMNHYQNNADKGSRDSSHDSSHDSGRDSSHSSESSTARGNDKDDFDNRDNNRDNRDSESENRRSRSSHQNSRRHARHDNQDNQDSDEDLADSLPIPGPINARRRSQDHDEEGDSEQRKESKTQSHKVGDESHGA